MYDIKQLFRDIKRYIYNIIKWSPILWKDRDYDYEYILNVLAFKLQNISKYIDKHKSYKGYKRDVERINLCIRLLDKLQTNFYKFEPQNFYKSKSTFNYDSETRNLNLNLIIIDDNLNEYFNKYKREYQKIQNQNSSVIWTATQLGTIIENKAKRILFKILEEQIFNWWD
jgi:hypothetical protein